MDRIAQILLALAVLLIVVAAIVALVSDEDWARISAFILAVLGIIFGAAAYFRARSTTAGP